MPRKDFIVRLDEQEIAALADAAVADLAHRFAGLVFQPLTGPDAPSGHAQRAVPGDLPGPLDVVPEADSDDGRWSSPLARFHALAHLSRAVERRAQAEAAEAARGGANYPQLGEAWKMSRQGARRRWPGLVFTAAPPSRPVPAHLPGAPAVRAPGTLRAYDVLLVEDDLADALLITEALQERGMAGRVYRVADGVDALEHLRSQAGDHPDLIVLDLNMPRMNGRELLAILRNDPDLSAIPVVVLTTSAAPGDIADAHEQYANAFVTKPVDLDDFVRAVESITAFFFDSVRQQGQGIESGTSLP